MKSFSEFNPDEDLQDVDERRVKRVNRIRGGKVQRRKKVSTKKGYTYRGGKLVRMSPAERRRRKLGQRRGARKRKAKKATALRKRKRTMRKRKSLGFNR